MQPIEDRQPRIQNQGMKQTESFSHQEKLKRNLSCYSQQQRRPGDPCVTLPGVSEEDSKKVIEAYKQGIARRDICSHLHWRSSKYTTIVKPVLDAYLAWGKNTMSDAG